MPQVIFSALWNLFKILRSMLKAWLDDLTLHEMTEKLLLIGLRIIIETCFTKGLFLSAKKKGAFRTQYVDVGALKQTMATLLIQPGSSP